MKKILFTLTLMLCSLVAMADVYSYSWSGKLGEKINFRLDLQESTFGTLIAEVTYFRKNGKVANIPAYGYVVNYDNGDSAYILNEYDGNKICGTFFFNINDKGIMEGSWSLLDKELKMNDIAKKDDPESDNLDFFHPANNMKEAAGEYSFKYDRAKGLEPGLGNCSLRKIDNNQIKWEMTQVTPNIAEAQGTGNFNNGYFTGKYCNFEFEAYVDKKFIYVKRTDESGPVDDWGMAATIEGIYVRK